MITIGVPGCQAVGGVSLGTALGKTNGFTLGIKVVLGDQWVLDLPTLDNVSKDPITIRDISIQQG